MNAFDAATSAELNAAVDLLDDDPGSSTWNQMRRSVEGASDSVSMIARFIQQEMSPRSAAIWLAA